MTAPLPFELARLSAWLKDHVPGFVGPLTARKFSVGQSNPTYLLTTPSATYVMRQRPFGNILPSAHAVDREFAVTSALYKVGFPVAEPYVLCEDENVIGAMFFVMKHVAGRTIIDGTLPDDTPEDRRRIYEGMVDLLAALHRLEPDAIGLADYGRAGGFFERQVARWTKQYRASQTREIPVFDKLIDWLPGRVPPTAGHAIVHGDYRIDNIIFAKDGPKALALVDWELSTLGDPLADLSYFLMSWYRDPDGGAGIAGLDLAALGIPTMDEVVERYCLQTGRDGVPNLDWYLAYNFFRLGGICQGIAKRIVDGNASNEKAVEAAAMAGPLATIAWQFAERAGA